MDIGIYWNKQSNRDIVLNFDYWHSIFQDVNDICIFEDCAGECGGVDTSCFGCDDVKNSGLVVDEPYDGSEGAWIGGCDCFEQIED